MSKGKKSPAGGKVGLELVAQGGGGRETGFATQALEYGNLHREAVYLLIEIEDIGLYGYV